jgi:hypothetical protein
VIDRCERCNHANSFFVFSCRKDLRFSKPVTVKSGAQHTGGNQRGRALFADLIFFIPKHPPA